MSIGDFEIEQPFVRHRFCSSCLMYHPVTYICPFDVCCEGDQSQPGFDVCHWHKEGL